MLTMPVLTPRDRLRLAKAHALLGEFLNGRAAPAAPRRRRPKAASATGPKRNRLGKTLENIPA